MKYAAILITLSLLFGAACFFAHESIGPSGVVSLEESEDTFEDYRHQESEISVADMFLIISLILSLIIGVFLMVFFVKKPSKIPHAIIHGLLFLVSLVWAIIAFFSYSLQKELIDWDIIWAGFPLIGFLLISGYSIFGLFKDKGFVEKRKYMAGLSSGTLLIFLIAIVFTLLLSPLYRDPIGIFVFILVPIGLVASFIMGVIGFFIDVFRK